MSETKDGGQVMREFEMTDADLADLLEAAKPVAMIALNCGTPTSTQQRANAAWAALGMKMGFDPTTVRPTRHGQPRFFWAKPTGQFKEGA